MNKSRKVPIDSTLYFYLFSSYLLSVPSSKCDIKNCQGFPVKRSASCARNNIDPLLHFFFIVHGDHRNNRRELQNVWISCLKDMFFVKLYKIRYLGFLFHYSSCSHFLHLPIDSIYLQTSLPSSVFLNTNLGISSEMWKSITTWRLRLL